jgi:hypothetical protein
MLILCKRTGRTSFLFSYEAFILTWAIRARGGDPPTRWRDSNEMFLFGLFHVVEVPPFRKQRRMSKVYRIAQRFLGHYLNSV